VPRSTQCGWLQAAFVPLDKIVRAMLKDAVATALCIATDATGAPVRRGGKKAGPHQNHHVFVFIADQRHVVFRHAAEHQGIHVKTWLEGYKGYLLADASSIYEVVYDLGMTEVACWAHLRRYFWRALGADPIRATEAIAIIGKLFEVQRVCVGIPRRERTAIRAAKAKPILAMMDDWAARNRQSCDTRGPLRAAITYYDNQREALRRFLESGDLRIDNNVCEGQLRRLVLGRANWGFFANERGLDWYVTFRSLIASCRMHTLNPQTYLEQVLRLAPHWPDERMVELSPAYWVKTLATLTDAERVYLMPPWEQPERIVQRRNAAAA
jgi:transposase